MRSTSTANFVSPALSAAPRSTRTHVRSPWLFLAGVGALLTISVQKLVMAQLAPHQMQRSVQLRQALAADTPDRANSKRVAADMRTQSAIQSSADSLAGYVLR